MRISRLIGALICVAGVGIGAGLALRMTSSQAPAPATAPAARERAAPPPHWTAAPATPTPTLGASDARTTAPHSSAGARPTGRPERAAVSSRRARRQSSGAHICRQAQFVPPLCTTDAVTLSAADLRAGAVISIASPTSRGFAAGIYTVYVQPLGVNGSFYGGASGWALPITGGVRHITLTVAHVFALAHLTPQHGMRYLLELASTARAQFVGRAAFTYTGPQGRAATGHGWIGPALGD